MKLNELIEDFKQEAARTRKDLAGEISDFSIRLQRLAERIESEQGSLNPMGEIQDEGRKIDMTIAYIGTLELLVKNLQNVSG